MSLQQLQRNSPKIINWREEKQNSDSSSTQATQLQIFLPFHSISDIVRIQMKETAKWKNTFKYYSSKKTLFNIKIFINLVLFIKH